MDSGAGEKEKDHWQKTVFSFPSATESEIDQLANPLVKSNF